MSYSRAGHVLLRLGAAFAFAYPAINAWSDPHSWLGYFPPFVLEWGSAVGLSPEATLHAFGAVEIIIALWILSGWRILLPSIVATAMLVAIVVFNSAQFQILFRDLSIAALTAALALMQLPRRGVASETREA